MAYRHFKITKTEKLPNAEALITGEIALPFLVELRAEAIKNLGQEAKLPGFRPGHIPESVLMQNFGEMRILEETAEIALAQEFSNILKEAKLSSLGRPEISVTKLALGIPLEFKIKIYLEPEFVLPDYKKLARLSGGGIVKEVDHKITNKEVQDVLKEIKKRGIKADLKEGEKLEDKIKENLVKEQEYRNQEKHRLKIMDDLVKASEIILPKILVEHELEKMLVQFKGEVEHTRLKWTDYLQQVKKTEIEIKEEWHDKAVDRVKAELIIAKIAEKEKIEPEKETIEHEAEHLLHHYPDADPVRVRLYVYTRLLTQKVLEFLEAQKS